MEPKPEFKLENETLSRINKELDALKEVYDKCAYTLENEGGYSKWSLEELTNFYYKLENSLIGYNIISKKVPKILKESEAPPELIEGFDRMEAFLESQLMSLVATTFFRNPSHNLVRTFKGSLWNDKIKNKEYYNHLFDWIIINKKGKEIFYNFLQNNKL
jgi:hypothetical protein